MRLCHWLLQPPATRHGLSARDAWCLFLDAWRLFLRGYHSGSGHPRQFLRGYHSGSGHPRQFLWRISHTFAPLRPRVPPNLRADSLPSTMLRGWQCCNFQGANRDAVLARLWSAEPTYFARYRPPRSVDYCVHHRTRQNPPIRAHPRQNGFAKLKRTVLR